jgi:phosphatidylserine decarboxylase
VIIRPVSHPAPERVAALKPLLDHRNDTAFVALLEASLQKAKSTAQGGDPARNIEHLDRGLFEALDWPTTFDAYCQFLVEFARWIPQQSSNPIWLAPGSEEHQEVYDRLCHFYWLIDQPVGHRETVVQDIPWFRDWLVEYASAWGAFLDTSESFSEEILQTFLANAPKYRVADSMIGDPPRPNAPSGWLTFNQFFARELNPGLRPIAAPTENAVVTAPADSTYKAHYPIAADSTIPSIVIKGTHKYASVRDLLAGSRYGEVFAGGAFIHFFLGPYSYHRFHTPVAGLVEECYPIRGRVYLKVQIAGPTPGTRGHQFQAYDASEGAYEFTQARGVITIDTSASPYGNVGVVAVVPVGMCQVSGVNMTHRIGQECRKGDEFGYFTFGGSDIIILFQAGTNPRYNPVFFATGSPPYSLYGSMIASLTPLSR